MYRKLNNTAKLATRSALLAALALASSTAAMAATPLALVNGWTNAPFSTRPAQVRTIGNVVHFSGAIGNGASSVAFTLPAGFRPLTDVYVHIDLCNSTNGRLHITPSGVTDVEEENGTFSNAQCFTSLDVANFDVCVADRVPIVGTHGSRDICRTGL